MRGIVSKLMEARHSKSMDSYELLARFCSRESVTKIILPLKEVQPERRPNYRRLIYKALNRWSASPPDRFWRALPG